MYLFKVNEKTYISGVRRGTYQLTDALISLYNIRIEYPKYEQA